MKLSLWPGFLLIKLLQVYSKREQVRQKENKIIPFGKTWSIRNVTAKACPKVATIGKELSTIKERLNLPWCFNRVRPQPAKLPDSEMNGPMRFFCFW